MPPGPLGRVLQARLVLLARWPRRVPDRGSEPRGPAWRLEELGPLGQPVLRAAEGLLDAMDLPPAPAQVERWTGAAPQRVPVPELAHCGLAGSEAARPEVIRRVVAGQWAVSGRLWVLEP